MQITKISNGSALNSDRHARTGGNAGVWAEGEAAGKKEQFVNNELFPVAKYRFD